MAEERWKKGFLILFTFYFFFFFAFPIETFARVGGGRSSGSRGSRPSTPPRSYSDPKPAPPSQTSKESAPSAKVSPQPSQQPQSSLWRGVLGGVIGGMIGGMLFRSLGFGSNWGGEGGGIGLFEILLMGGLIYGAYWFFKKRRRAALADASYQSSVETAAPYDQASDAPGYDRQPEEEWDKEKGLGYIRQMDPSFDEKTFQDLSMDHFFKLQGAWASNQLAGVRELLTEEMFKIIRDDMEKMKLERRIDKLENITVRSVDIVEVWQESGRDYITVRFYANLLDYTMDEVTGQVLSGSKTDPVKFVEFWTFVRAVGNNPWQLSAITQPG